MCQDILSNHKAREISRALSFYHRDFTKYFALLVSLTEAIPLQVSNQVRNAFTHLARADQATDIAVVDTQVQLAIGHLERGIRDCLKLCVVFQHERIEGLLASVRFKYGFVTPALANSRRIIVSERQTILEDETRGHDDVATRYETLFEQMVNIEEQIHQHYDDIKNISNRYTRFFLRYFRVWAWPLLVVIGGVLGQLLRTIVLHFMQGTP